MCDSRKWSCEYCTYSNWPATKKCAMCNALRPQVFITSDGDPDIYEMASLSMNAPEPKAPKTERVTTSATAPWTCKKCTFLNVSKSVKCSMCSTIRNARPEEILPVAPVQTCGVQPLSVAVSEPETQLASQQHSQRNSPKPRTSPRSVESTKEMNNDKNRALAAAVRGMQEKWSCSACTFDNDPESLKCVLCLTPRAPAQESAVAAATLDCKPPSRLLPPQPASSIKQVDNRVSAGKDTLGSQKSQQGSATALASAASNSSGATNGEGEPCLAVHTADGQRRLTEIDRLWLSACTGIAAGDIDAVDAYLNASGDPGRQLSREDVTLLGNAAAYEPGYTLLHLAVRHGREDVLAAMLGCGPMAAKKKKRLPPHVAPNLATEILRLVSLSLRQRKGDFPCYFLSDCVTFALPVEIGDFVTTVQDQLFDDILDQDVQKELEIEESTINWNVDLSDRGGCRLYALWNRTAGDCLLDSVLQATWGVFDRDNTLRRALAESLSEGAMTFYPRWKEYETVLQAQLYDYSLDEDQWQQDWTEILSIASQPGSALEQMHIFALAHILRRPIIVYGVKYVKTFRGESLDLARFQGVYLPLLWEASFCWKSPIALGYTRGHFSALVPMEVDTSTNTGAGAQIEDDNNEQIIYLPLVDTEGALLPLHFIARSQIGCEEAIIRERLVCDHVSGILCAEQALGRQPPLVRQMVDEWLDRYRRLSHAAAPPHPPRSAGGTHLLSDVRNMSRYNNPGGSG